MRRSLEDDARRSMLARLAGDLDILAHADNMDWTCCEQTVPHVNVFGQTEFWLWRFCNSGMPGEYYRTEHYRTPPCGHWHHQHEPPAMAMAAL